MIKFEFETKIFCSLCYRRFSLVNPFRAISKTDVKKRAKGHGWKFKEGCAFCEECAKNKAQ